MPTYQKAVLCRYSSVSRALSMVPVGLVGQLGKLPIKGIIDFKAEKPERDTMARTDYLFWTKLRHLPAIISNSTPTQLGESKSVGILTKQDLSNAPSGTSEKVFERPFQSASIYFDICHLTRRNVYVFRRQITSVDISSQLTFGGCSPIAEMEIRLGF